MRTRFKIVTTVLLFTFSGYATAQSKTAAALKKERSNLEKTSSPVQHTRIAIKVADLLITLTTEDAHAGNDRAVEENMNEYARTIEDARSTMIKTGADAHKHPAGFKDLEIAMRKQQRRLADIGKLVDFDKRSPIEKALKLASDISDKILRLMLLREPNAPKKP